MPEPVLSNYAIGQLARRLGLPLRCGGSLTASKIEDAQAAYDLGRLTLAVSAVNLGGRKAFDSYHYLLFPLVIPILPRSAYVTLRARI